MFKIMAMALRRRTSIPLVSRRRSLRVICCKLTIYLLALKHYTSKLSTYDDLDSLRTFGFRGEALSSLCALSNFHITTARAGDAPRGTKLEYDISGKLKSKSVTASQKGTTVSVERIFHNLPVRRKELEKNVKRDYGKALNLLQAYACISAGVKFSVSNQPAKGNRVVAFSTRSNPTTKENITNVYGAKTTAALVALDLRLEMQSSIAEGLRSQNLSDVNSTGIVHIKGHISRPIVGEGRQTPDRQMFFVNSRPCSLPQVAKAFNEVYKSYNVTQSPFIFADLLMDTDAYDVNVSPDKRIILLHEQTALLESLKTALMELFDNHDQSVPKATPMNAKLPAFKPLTVTNPPPIADQVDRPNRSVAVSERSPELDVSASFSSTPGQPRNFIQDFAERKTEERRITPLRNTANGASKGKEKDTKAQQDDPNQQSRERTTPPQVIPAKTSTIDEEVISEEEQEVPRFIADFNARLASQRAKSSTTGTASPETPNLNESVVEADAEDEEGILSTQPGSQDRRPGPVQNAFDRMRPKRSVEHTATVTVGGTTTQVTLGSSSKRRRVHTPQYGLDGQKLSLSSPLMSKSLRQFAAPGTQFDDEEASDSEGASHRSRTKSVGVGKDQETDMDTGEDSDQHNGTIPISPSPGPDEVTERDSHSAVSPVSVGQDSPSDAEYLDEIGKKKREEERVARMIARAEEEAAQATTENLERASTALSSRSRKDSTLQLVLHLDTSILRIEKGLQALNAALQRSTGKQSDDADADADSDNTAKTAEEQLSIQVSKADFGNMRIVGQFNLGFIVALRPASASEGQGHVDEDLFIIDQHAADEKYNFERLSSNTIIQNQRMVRPLTLHLTAVEEEVVLNHPRTLLQNGFQIETDTSGDEPVGRRCKLVGLPMSKEVVFNANDLEELIALLGEDNVGETLDESVETSFDDSDSLFLPSAEARSNNLMSTHVVRPSKIRRLLAMRACRSSIMVGRTLTNSQMAKVVRNMGQMDKPWNCPHGRPTMRHLKGFGLEHLGEVEGWREGMGLAGLGEEEEVFKWPKRED